MRGTMGGFPTMFRCRQGPQILQDLDQRGQLSVLLRGFQPHQQLLQPSFQLFFVNHGLWKVVFLLKAWRAFRSISALSRSESQEHVPWGQAVPDSHAYHNGILLYVTLSAWYYSSYSRATTLSWRWGSCQWRGVSVLALTSASSHNFPSRVPHFLSSRTRSGVSVGDAAGSSLTGVFLLLRGHIIWLEREREKKSFPFREEEAGKGHRAAAQHEGAAVTPTQVMNQVCLLTNVLELCQH